MSFLVPLALLFGALALLPILAHALWRGPSKPLVFPATHLVPRATASSKKRSRIEDRSLLALRVLLLLLLALLGASPLLRCSRLSLEREGGGSLAVALVIDDSASMKIQESRRTRLARSIESAEQLLDGAQPGDAFSLILAGRPARLLLPPTVERERIRDALARITPSDRSTDLRGALTLARSSLEQQPQPTHQVLVFSDFAEETPFTDQDLKGVQAPLPELRAPFDNCALTEGSFRGKTASVELVCTEKSSLEGREVTIHAVTREAVERKRVELGEPLGRAKAVEGVLRIPIELTDAKTLLRAKLSPSPETDALPDDDETELLQEEDRAVIGVRADAETAGTKTGAVTVFELGLRALDPHLPVEPLSLLPQTKGDLARFSALVIDDPPGFTPETQEALEQWLQEGGVALLLVGSSASRAPLGAGFWPFVKNQPAFERTTSRGAREGAATVLGPAWDTWVDLGAEERALLDLPEGSRVLVPWSDGAPLLAERHTGQGLVLISALPASVDASDFALRPAFLGLLARVVEESQLRRGAHSAAVGSSWVVPHGTRVLGPSGPLPLTRLPDGSFAVEPTERGRYVFQAPTNKNTREQSSVRYATSELGESLIQPRSLAEFGDALTSRTADAPQPISREVALLVLVLVFLELALRARKSARLSLDGPTSRENSPPAPSSSIESA